MIYHSLKDQSKSVMVPINMSELPFVFLKTLCIDQVKGEMV